MKQRTQVAVVLAGYLAAFLIASALVAIRIALTNTPDAAASSGMYAAGDAMLFVAVFGLASLLPTAAALYFLRTRPMVWTVLATVSVVVASTGVAAIIVY